MKDIKKKKLKESSGVGAALIDDGPPTFYRTFSDYKKFSKEMFEEIDWEVLDYILSKGAEDPELDYTLSYNIVPVVAYGKSGDGEGYSDPVGKYKERLSVVLDSLGWEILKWMGIKGKKTTGVDVESPGQYIRDTSLKRSRKGRDKDDEYKGIEDKKDVRIEERIDISKEIVEIFEKSKEL